MTKPPQERWYNLVELMKVPVSLIRFTPCPEKKNNVKHNNDIVPAFQSRKYKFF